MSMKGGITPNTLNKPSAKAPININPNVALIIEALLFLGWTWTFYSEIRSAQKELTYES